jgi:hypothetical protein
MQKSYTFNLRKCKMPQKHVSGRIRTFLMSGLEKTKFYWLDRVSYQADNLDNWKCRFLDRYEFSSWILVYVWSLASICWTCFRFSPNLFALVSSPWCLQSTKCSNEPQETTKGNNLIKLKIKFCAKLIKLKRLRAFVDTIWSWVSSVCY